MPRDYDNRARAEAARATRRAILAAAHRLIVDHGYAALSIAALAEAAGVSPQTVYNSIGGKPTVLKAVYDVALVGDDEPIPLSDRPEIARLAAARTRAEWAAAYAHLATHIYTRVGDIVGAVLTPGSALDRGAGEFAATIDAERRIGTTNAVTAFANTAFADTAFAEHPHPPVDLTATIDAVWALNSPEVYDRLVRRSGWTAERYESWLTAQLAATLTTLGW